MAKTFEVSFRIHGALDGSLQAALQAAANSMRGLGNAARQASAAAQASRGGLAGLAVGLNQLQQAAQKYKAVQDALRQTTADMSKASANLRSAREKYAADTAAVEQLKAKLQELRAAQSRLGTQKSSGNASLKQLRQDLQGLKQAYAEAKRAGDQMKMSTLASQIKSTQGAITSQKAAVKAMADEYKQLSAQVKQTKTDLSAAQAAQSASGRGLSSAQSDAQRLAASYKNQQAALNALKASLSSAGFNVSNFAASEARLAGDIDRVNAALRQQQALSSAQANSNAASQNLTMAGANFMGAIATAQQVAAPFQAAIDNAMTFEHSMSRVKALTQTGNIMAGNLAQVDAEMAKLEGQARELGSTTQFTMTQAADAMGYLGMAGWKTEQIYGTMPGMLNLAAGAGTDLARTADIVSDNMTAMQVPVEKAGHFMDVYAYALTNSNVNLESLGETMKYAAPVAAAFGASLEDATAMTMMMGNAGIKGSMAGTAMRMGLLRLSGPPKKASKALDEMGISLSDATAMAMESEAELARLGVQYDKNAPPMEKMGTIISQLSGKMATMTAEEKLASVSAIFGANAASGWINILEQGPEVFNQYLNALRNCDGYSEQFAKTMNDDTRGAMIALESAMDAVQNSIGSALLPAVRSAAEAFTPIASAIALFIQAHPGVIQACAAIAAAFTAVIVGATGVKLAFAGWSFIQAQIALVRVALASLSSGAMFSGLIARLTAVRAAMAGMATTAGWSGMATGISAAFSGIVTKATAAATAIRTFFATMTLGSVASSASAAISSIGTALMTAGRAAMVFALSPVGVALMALALAGMYCYQNWDKLAPVFSNVASVLSGMFQPAIDAIMPAVRNLGRAFDILVPAVQNAFSALSDSGISGIFSTIGSALVEGIAVAVTAVAGIAATIVTAFANVGATVLQVLTLITGAIRNVLEGNWTAAWDKMKSIATTVVEGIKTTIMGIADSIKGIFDGIGKVRDIFNFSKDMPTNAAVRRHSLDASTVQAAQAASATPAPESQPIDTSATQAALDQVGSSAQTAATNLQGVDQASTGVQNLSTNATTAATGMQTFNTAATTSATGVQNLSTNAATAATNAQNLGTSAQNATTGTDALGVSAQGATAGTDALGASASGATGGISGLADAAGAVAAALSAKASEIAAIKISAPTVAAAANAQGGIYRKGAFLTTFAEKSPEAAIPLDNSQRAVDLWTKTGQMLGQIPGDASGYDAAPKDALGNLSDADEFNRVTEKDDIQVTRSKLLAQRKKFELQRMAERFADERIQAEQAQAAAAIQTASAVQKTAATISQAATQFSATDYERDELGNIKGLDIPEFNRIKADDDLKVARWKGEAQLEQLKAQRQAQRTQVPQPQAVTPEVQTAQAAAAIQTARSSIVPRNRRMTAASERRLQRSPSPQPQPSPQPFPQPTREQSQQNLLRTLLPAIPGISGPQVGLLEGLTDKLSKPHSSSGGEGMTFNATFNVNVSGQAKADEVQRGIEQAIPSLDDWARKMAAFKHDEARRSFD